MRLIPDIAIGAAGRMPGYYIVAFVSRANRLGIVAGTSLSSPAWAGYSRLIAQIYGPGPLGKMGRLGPMNPQLYVLGNMGSNSGLIDITAGDNAFNGVSGFPAGVGYDLTTGWGSPDMSTALISYLAGGQASATPVALSDPPKTVIANAGTLTLSNSSTTSSLSVDSIAVKLSRPSIFKSVSMTSGARTVTPLKSATMVFKFSPAIAIPASGMADFTVGATMIALAQAGTPQSVLSVAAMGVSANVAGGGVTFLGLPASLGSIRLTH
jgi:subtilase family serine protease